MFDDQPDIPTEEQDDGGLGAQLGDRREGRTDILATEELSDDRLALEEIGKNSVSPCTMPSTSASSHPIRTP